MAITPPTVLWRTPCCSACLKPNLIALRTFTTTSPRPAYGPESPKYIKVPQPPQRSSPHEPRIKGILPVPRDVFRRKAGGHKSPSLGKQFDAKSSRAGKGHTEAEKIQNEWKQKMTDMRKSNFTEGLRELAVRKSSTIAAAEARTRQKEAERQRILSMPVPDDELFTSSSIAMVMRTQLGGVIPDPNREERLATMKANVAAHQAQKAGERRDALHTLYMHARSFITTETQLDAEVEKVFGTEKNPVVFGNGNSKWSEGAPDSIAEMLAKANRTSGTMRDAGGSDELLQKRTRTIAETLTGGKI